MDAMIRTLATLVIVPLAAGCMMIGPDYRRPTAPVAGGWIARDDSGIAPDTEPIGPWWDAFGDPALSDLIAEAYRQNPSLQAAGVRVLKAQANRGIAIGTLFPQMQNAVGGFRHTVASKNAPLAMFLSTPGERGFNNFFAGFDVAWELDFWGMFRRGVESADASLLAAVANYDDVLITLLGEVAANYIGIRTAQAEVEVARSNADIQRKSYAIASHRAKEGAVSDVDPAQSASLLYATEAQIPLFEAQIDEQSATLSSLLGVPPRRVQELVGEEPSNIPVPPERISVGVPADLLRRRPDVRRSERVLAAQSAQIGVAKADLLPQISLVGTIGLDAQKAAEFFEGKSFTAFTGPQFEWAILNYGRITNNVRVQDAEYQALVNDYTNTVLGAQADVESAIAALRGARLRAASLTQSVAAAQQVVDLTGRQYAEGAVDFTTVLVAQQLLVQQEDLLTSSRGQTALAMVTLYKALGGGWEPWEGRSVISEETAEQMKSRTRWGDLVTEREQQRIEEAAGHGTEQDHGWWRWRWWWPQW